MNDLVHRHVRAERRLRPGVAHVLGPAGRRRVGDQRAEDLDELRRGGRLLLPDLSHVDRGAAPRRDQRDRRPDGCSWYRGQADHRHDHEPALLRGVLRRCTGAGDQPGRRRGRHVQADDAATRARAGRHRPARVEPRPVPRRARTGRPRRPARSASGRGARDRVSNRPHPGGARGAPPGAAWVLGGDQVLLHRTRVAGRRVRRRRARGRGDAVVADHRRPDLPRPATRSWAARRT